MEIKQVDIATLHQKYAMLVTLDTDVTVKANIQYLCIME